MISRWPPCPFQLAHGNEEVRELLAKGKKKGKLDSGELMEAVDDLNLESYQTWISCMTLWKL